MPPILTPLQRRLLAYLQAAETMATLRELAIYMGLSPTSQNAIMEMLAALEKKGYIKRPRSSRAREPVTILRPLPGVLSPRAKLSLIRAALERLQLVRGRLISGGAPLGADAAQLLAVADREAVEGISAIIAEQPEPAPRSAPREVDCEDISTCPHQDGPP